MFDGNSPWMKEEGTSISCCTDGLKPVIFELRRIEKPVTNISIFIFYNQQHNT